MEGDGMIVQAEPKQELPLQDGSFLLYGVGVLVTNLAEALLRLHHLTKILLLGNDNSYNNCMLAVIRWIVGG
jgi:hypothetical protein